MKKDKLKELEERVKKLEQERIVLVPYCPQPVYPQPYYPTYNPNQPCYTGDTPCGSSVDWRKI